MTQKPTDERAGAGPRAFSLITVTLLKGVVYRESDPALWQSLADLQSRVRDYVAHLGLELVLDESEGYAYLRQRPPVEGDAELPRLVHRRQLSFPVSLLLALLRKKLAELDAASGETRLILASEEIADLMRDLPSRVGQRGEAHRQDPRPHQQGGGARLPAATCAARTISSRCSES